MNDTDKPFPGSLNPWKVNTTSQNPNSTSNRGTEQRVPLERTTPAKTPVQNLTAQTSQTVVSPENLTARWKTNTALHKTNTLQPEQKNEHPVPNKLNPGGSTPSTKPFVPAQTAWRKTTPHAPISTGESAARPLTHIEKDNQSQSKPAIANWRTRLESRQKKDQEPDQEWKERVHEELEQLIKSPTVPTEKPTASTVAPRVPSALNATVRPAATSLSEPPASLSQPVKTDIPSPVIQKTQPAVTMVKNPVASSDAGVTSVSTHAPVTTTTSPPLSVPSDHIDHTRKTPLAPTKTRTDHPAITPENKTVLPAPAVTTPIKATAAIQQTDNTESDLEPERAAPNLFDLDTQTSDSHTTINHQNHFSRTEHARFDALEQGFGPSHRHAKHRSHVVWWILGGVAVLGLGLLFKPGQSPQPVKQPDQIEALIDSIEQQPLDAAEAVKPELNVQQLASNEQASQTEPAPSKPNESIEAVNTPPSQSDQSAPPATQPDTTKPAEDWSVKPKRDWLVAQIFQPDPKTDDQTIKRVERPQLLKNGSTTILPESQTNRIEPPAHAKPQHAVAPSPKTDSLKISHAKTGSATIGSATIGSVKTSKKNTAPKPVHQAKTPTASATRKKPGIKQPDGTPLPKQSSSSVWILKPSSNQTTSPVTPMDAVKPPVEDKVNFVVSYGCFSNINEIIKRQERIKEQGWPVLTSHYTLDKTPMTCLFGGPFTNPKKADQATGLFAEKGCMQIPKEPLQAP